MNTFETLQYIKSKGVKLENGLSHYQIDKIQKIYNFIFPHDLLDLLSTNVPFGDGFPNWHEVTGKYSLSVQMEGPLDGILFDIINNSFWPNDILGVRPEDKNQAEETFKIYYNSLPPLIPIYSHRYMPSEFPNISNQIISVYQTDVIIYGDDLGSYFQNEFGKILINNENIRKVGYAFWDNVIYGKYDS